MVNARDFYISAISSLDNKTLVHEDFFGNKKEFRVVNVTEDSNGAPKYLVRSLDGSQEISLSPKDLSSYAIRDVQSQPKCTELEEKIFLPGHPAP